MTVTPLEQAEAELAWQDRLDVAFRDALRSTERTVLERYAARAVELPEEAVVAAASDVGIDEVWDDGIWDDAVTVDVAPELTLVVEEAALLNAERIGLGFAPDTSAIVESHLASIKTFSPTIRRRLERTLVQGLDKGWSVDRITSQIRQSSSWNEATARSFARTETIAAQNGSAEATYRAAGVEGKVWIATGDSRTRDTHLLADGQIQPINELFIVGASSGSYPGDVSFDAAERVNCRCRMAAQDIAGTERFARDVDRAWRAKVAARAAVEAVTADAGMGHGCRPMVTPDEAGLREADEPDEMGCGNCAHFEACGSCTCAVVIACVGPEDICDLYRPAPWFERSGAVEDEELAIVADVPWLCTGLSHWGGVSVPLSTFTPAVSGELNQWRGWSVLASYEFQGNGVVVTVEPTEEQRAALAQPGGEPAEVLHLTLVSLANGAQEDRATVERVVAEVAAMFGPLAGEVAGIGTFGDEDGTEVSLALIDAPGLAELRHEVIEALEAAGIPIHRNHDFQPHITLAYGPIPETASVVGLALDFEDLTLRWGPDRTDWPLVAEEAQTMPYFIDPESDACDAETPIAVVNEASGEVMGCHASLADAEQQITALLIAEAEEGEEPVPAEPVVEEAIADAEVLAEATGVELEGVDVPLGGEADLILEFVAVAPHDTCTDDGAWDGPANEARARSGEGMGYYEAAYAWYDSDGDLEAKASWRFIHHFVNETGDPGCASTVAASAGIGVLNGARGGTTIPDEDRLGVWEHLAQHLADAGLDAPELMSVDDAAFVARAVEAGLEVDSADAASVAAARDAGQQMLEVVTTEVTTITQTIELEIEADGDEPVDAARELLAALLSSIPEDELAAELARRWAEDLVSDARAAVQATKVFAADEDDEVADDNDFELVLGRFAEDGEIEWEGTIIPEGIPSGDRRMIAEGALTWRVLPLPLMLMKENAEGHDGSVLAGSILELDRVGHEIVGRGRFDSGPDGQEAKRLLKERTLRGVSADIDSVVIEFRDPVTGGPVDMEDVIFGEAEALEVLIEGRIMGATLTPFPAFQEAHIVVLDPTTARGDAAVAAVVAAGGEYDGSHDVWRVHTPAAFALAGQEVAAPERPAVVAAAGEIPINPPGEWFELQDDGERAFEVDAEGRCYGLAIEWDTCHIGQGRRCLNASDFQRDGFSHFYAGGKRVLTDSGELVEVGTIYADTVHPNLLMEASDAQAFYAHTGCALADVRLYETSRGIVAAGAMRPDVSPIEARAFRGSDVSPDWRWIQEPRGRGRHRLIGLLACNVSAFLVEAVAASAGAAPGSARATFTTDEDATPIAAVGLGMVRKRRVPDAETVAALEDRIVQLEIGYESLASWARPARAAAAREKLASSVASTGESCSCGGTCGSCSTTE